MAGQLEVNVLGGGPEGESVVLGMPDGKWAVIDCYTSDLKNPATNPTLEFLIARGVKTLEFVGVTHPHSDHYRGISHLLGQLKVGKFWGFAATDVKTLTALVRVVGAKAKRGKDDESEQSSNELENIFREVGDKKIPTGELRAHNEVYRDDNNKFLITCLAPDDSLITKYHTHLAKCFDEKDGRLIAKKFNRPLSPNTVSAGFLIKFGSTSVLLGGDMERRSWKYVLDDAKFNNHNLSAHAIKVSHHGSKTGYLDDAWTYIKAAQKPLALIAPYYKRGLPDDVGKKEICNASDRVLISALKSTKATVSTGSLLGLIALATHMRDSGYQQFTNVPGLASVTFDDAGNLKYIRGNVLTT